MTTVMPVVFVLVRSCSIGAGLMLLLGAMWFGSASVAFLADVLVASALIGGGVWRDTWLGMPSHRLRCIVLIVAGMLGLIAQIVLRARSSRGLAEGPIDTWIINGILILGLAWRMLYLRRNAVR